MNGPYQPPPAVFALWWIAVVLSYAVLIPRAVYLLHSVWRASRSIERYAREALEAAGGIAANTVNIPALDETIACAKRLNATAGSVAARLQTVADVVEERSKAG